MATLTVSQIYAARACVKLPLPAVVQENIAKLRIKPMTFKPFHKAHAPRPFHARKQPMDNWREKMLVDMVRRVREREDPEYSEIFAIFNKVTSSSVAKLSNDAIGYIEKRDDQFRLRIATLLFDKAITNHGFASVMAECAKHISAKIEDMKEDIQTQVSMFPTLYNINETLTFPLSSDPEYATKLIECFKQKEKRRGYAKFMMELFLRGLVTEDCVKNGLKDVIAELTDIASQARTEQTEENVGQFAVFLLETAKLATKQASIRSFMSASISSILKTDKAAFPSINMKSRFKLEDAFKLVQ